MSQPVTIHVVQAFDEMDGFPVAEEPIACQSAAQARAKAQALKHTKLGVIAWSRTSPNPDLGEWGPPVLLARFGAIPDDFEGTEP
ncbi:hypothetical protein [Xanthobacter tagetidis]|uniref:Uncharacterized protein n=1 Tax=Xanthobacter tagetidis TaxID=60216 RepID=A0A3L7AHK0_9HYPH|nr:hypothetical protein [Xanthobacter tagetidis]MBB6306258.1 hypothetical protein [Xanthobacter tagetidis]RLP79534.1 hypothetical protein D9R14_07680 [Xanthobacter tagetidis]